MTANPQQIESQIAQQRDQLASTVDALSAKLDVKARAGDKAAELKDAATTSTGKPKPALIVPAALVVLAAAGALIWRRRH